MSYQRRDTEQLLDQAREMDYIIKKLSRYGKLLARHGVENERVTADLKELESLTSDSTSYLLDLYNEEALNEIEAMENARDKD